MVQSATKTFFAILHKDRDSTVGVVFPDLPGCFSAGETYDEAIINAAQALRMYAQAERISGRPLPQPRCFEDMYADKEIRDEAAGAPFVAIPLTSDNQGSDALRPAKSSSGPHRQSATGQRGAISNDDGAADKQVAKVRKRKPSAA